MSDNLFDIPETLSPRLQWLDKHGVFVYETKFIDEPHPKDAWTADAAGQTASGATKDEAIASLAKLLKIPLWNEEVKQ